MSRLRTWRGKTISVSEPTAAEVHVADIVTPLFRMAFPTYRCANCGQARGR